MSTAAQLQDWSATRGWSGAVLLTQDGETLLESCAGEADRAAHVPVGPQTRFGLASVTKMFTAVAVVDQVATGRLTFDTRVVDVLPPERRPTTLLPRSRCTTCSATPPGSLTTSRRSRPTAPRRASTPTSGSSARRTRCSDRPTSCPSSPTCRRTGRPGERYWYSNAGYVLLGLVLEEVSGSPYTELVQARVFDRAGMGESGFFRLDEPVPDLAVGYVRLADGSWRTNHFSMPVIGGADGGAQSTCRDLDRFLTAYDDGSLLGDLRDVVVHPHADAGDGFFEGYGVHLYPDGRIGHGGGDPGVDVLVHRWPDEAANLVVLGNTEGLTSDVRDLVLASWRSRSRGGRGPGRAVARRPARHPPPAPAGSRRGRSACPRGSPSKVAPLPVSSRTVASTSSQRNATWCCPGGAHCSPSGPTAGWTPNSLGPLRKISQSPASRVSASLANGSRRTSLKKARVAVGSSL